MDRIISVMGAPSSIGIKPYDDGSPRRLYLAPGVLRERGLLTSLDAKEAGDVVPPAGYRDVRRPRERPCNEEDVIVYSRKIAERIAAVASEGGFVLLLGGDCSILLGALLGFQRACRASMGLVYIDAHADFATLDDSPSGSAASMCLALATGRNDTALARLAGPDPLVRMADVVHIGGRDDAEPWYGVNSLRASAALNLPQATIHEKGMAYAAYAALERIDSDRGRKFWIHVDADVLDPAVMPAVDSPLPGGMNLDELTELLGIIAQHPGALGMQLTIYDPTLDLGHVCASSLVTLLKNALRDTHETIRGTR